MQALSITSLPEIGQVSTLHILKSGEIISTLEEYMKVEDRFTWANRRTIIARLLQLQKYTDRSRKSVIVLYEEGQVIREYINVERQFYPVNFC